MILDTNALSAAADGEAAALNILARADRVALPVIVLGEYRLGIAQSRQREIYENWLSECVAAVDILEIEEATSHHYATIALELKRVGKPIPTNDIWIGALCRQHSLPLLSRDRHFDAVSGIERIHW
ncbi:MAG TPA: type II toxin-antitoxin system VapC family toxin [Candidatus Acidoferrales bacterium]|nr:type II toxin-antitoxin system VapC family toxin [Candidatus Acidoferrales bacterium]